MRRYLTAALMASIALTASMAMAATLGGLSSTGLGADDSVILSCDTDGVTSSYTVAYDATDARDEVTAVLVGSVAAPCAGQTLTVTLTDNTDAVLDTASVVAVSGANTVATGTPPAAEDVSNVHIVITG
ncbi:MAG: hypothetical protein ACR2P0_00335 [Acidimicrobiales bacterium]